MRFGSRFICTVVAVGLMTPAVAAAAPEEPAPDAPETSPPPDPDPPTTETPTTETPTTEAPVEPAPTTAPPKPEDPTIAAKTAYDRGRMLYDQAKYEEALGAFLDAQRLYASPDHHFNIARCYEALGRYTLAIEYYRAYLRSNPADRANIESTISRIDKIIASGSTEPEPEPQPDPQPDSQPDPIPPQTDRQDYPGRPLEITGAVLTGVGAALALGGGIGAGVVASDRSEQVDQVFEGGNPEQLSLDEARTLDEQGRRLEGVQIATAVIGGAVAVTGVALLATGLAKKRKGSVSAMIGRGVAGVSLRGRF